MNLVGWLFVGKGFFLGNPKKAITYHQDYSGFGLGGVCSFLINLF
jgi:hypothetical protein